MTLPALMPGPDNSRPSRQRCGTALPGTKSGGGGVLTEGAGEPAEGAAASWLPGELAVEPAR